MPKPGGEELGGAEGFHIVGECAAVRGPSRRATRCAQLLFLEASARPALGDVTLAFGAEFFAALAAENDNEIVIISPTRVAIALAMLEPGAVGEARRQLQELLRIDDADAFHAAMNALEPSLEAREVRAVGTHYGPVVYRRGPRPTFPLPHLRRADRSDPLPRPRARPGPTSDRAQRRRCLTDR